MGRPLSDSQRSLWAEVGAILAPFATARQTARPAPTPVESVPTAETAAPLPVVVAPDEIPVEAPVEIVAPIVASVPPPEPPPMAQSVPEPAPLAPVEEPSPVVAEIPAVEVAAASVEVDEPPAATIDWRGFAHVPVAQFFSAVAWDGNDSTPRAALPTLEVPKADATLDLASLSSGAFFSAAIPWQARGQKPETLALSSVRANGLGTGIPSLQSIMGLATQTALGTARRLAATGRNGSALAFFSQLTWERQAAA